MRAMSNFSSPFVSRDSPASLSKSRFQQGVSERGTKLRIVNFNVPESWKLMTRHAPPGELLEVRQRDQS